MDSTIKVAIATKHLLEFDYDGYHPIVEPHVYGIQDGKRQILVYQVDGESSSGNLPNWRRMDLNKISDMHMLDQTFAGPRSYPSGKHSSFDTTIAVVR
jgi:hypothetical protein